MPRKIDPIAKAYKAVLKIIQEVEVGGHDSGDVDQFLLLVRSDVNHRLESNLHFNLRGVERLLEHRAAPGYMTPEEAWASVAKKKKGAKK